VAKYNRLIEIEWPNRCLTSGRLTSPVFGGLLGTRGQFSDRSSVSGSEPAATHTDDASAALPPSSDAFYSFAVARGQRLTFDEPEVALPCLRSAGGRTVSRPCR